MAVRVGRPLPPVVNRLVEKPITAKGVEVRASWWDLKNDIFAQGVKISSLDRYPALQAQAGRADENQNGWLDHDELFSVANPKHTFLRPGVRAAAEEAKALRSEVLATSLVDTLVQAGGTKKEFAKATAVQLDDELVIHFKDTGFTLVAASLAREDRDLSVEGPPKEPTPESIARCPNPFMPGSELADCQVDLIDPQGNSVLWDRYDYGGFDLRFDLETGKLSVDQSGMRAPTTYDLDSGKIENKWLTVEGGKVARLDVGAALPWSTLDKVSSAKYVGDGNVDYVAREPSGQFEERRLSLPFSPESMFGPVSA